MELTQKEISTELIELSQKNVELEKLRNETARIKNKLVGDVQDINLKLQEINSNIDANKTQAQILKQRGIAKRYKFDEREIERLLYRACLILKGVKERGIGLDSSEERLIKDIDVCLSKFNSC